MIRRKPLLEVDPLNIETPIKESNYRTILFSKSIHVPEGSEKLFFIKKASHLQLLCTLENSIKTFQEMIDDSFMMWTKDFAEYFISELRGGNTTFDWTEVCFRCKMETGAYPKEWDEQEVIDYLNQFEKGQAERSSEHLRSIIIQRLCLNGLLVVKDSRTDEYMSEIQYQGEGFEVEPLCGSGGVSFYTDGVLLCHYQTWIS